MVRSYLCIIVLIGTASVCSAGQISSDLSEKTFYVYGKPVCGPVNKPDYPQRTKAEIAFSGAKIFFSRTGQVFFQDAGETEGLGLVTFLGQSRRTIVPLPGLNRPVGFSFLAKKVASGGETNVIVRIRSDSKPINITSESTKAQLKADYRMDIDISSSGGLCVAKLTSYSMRITVDGQTPSGPKHDYREDVCAETLLGCTVSNGPPAELMKSH